MAKLKRLFGEKIFELRTKANMTQEQLAEKCNISNDTISRIERGVRSPSFSVLENIAKALTVEPYELFNFSDKKVVPKKRAYELTDLTNILKNRNPEEIQMINKLVKVIFEMKK